jgi:hypothetical protein
MSINHTATIFINYTTKDLTSTPEATISWTVSPPPNRNSVLSGLSVLSDVIQYRHISKQQGLCYTYTQLVERKLNSKLLVNSVSEHVLKTKHTYDDKQELKVLNLLHPSNFSAYKAGRRSKQLQYLVSFLAGGRVSDAGGRA